MEHSYIWHAHITSTTFFFPFPFLLFPFKQLGECHCWYTRVSPRAHVAKFYVRLQLIRSALRTSKFSVLKFIEIVILWLYYLASLLASVSFCTFVTSLFNFLDYFVWLRITDEGSVPFMVHIVNEIRFKIVYTSWSLFIFQPLHSFGECHCCLTRESLRAHAAKLYGRLQLIRRVFRASTFSVLKFIEIVILGVYSPSLLASVCFCTFVISLFSYFVWLRIPDDGSVLEMRIWSILLSYCKSQAFTLNTLWGFCKIYAQSIFFVLAGGGDNFDITSEFVLSLCNQISTSTFDLRFALMVPPQSEIASYAPVMYVLSNRFTNQERPGILYTGKISLLFYFSSVPARKWKGQGAR